MAKSLVIVESPAKAKTINKYLGKDFIVKSSVGHIRDLPTSGSSKKAPMSPKERAQLAAQSRKLPPEEREKRKKERSQAALIERMGIDPENGWNPYYETMPGKEKVISELKKLAKNSDTIYLATDLDREGEAIAWHLKETLGESLGKQSDQHNTAFKRVVFNEITEKAIQEAFAEPGELNMDHVNAQQTRRFLDRVVGYMVSPLLWKKVARGLSAGRVQSVAVKLVVEREREIHAFNPEEYWEVYADLLTQSQDEIHAQVAKYQGKEFRPTSQKETDAALAVLEKADYQLTRRETRPTSSRPKAPFITSTLQQAASTRMGFGVKKTMMLAQRLYEAGYISYMRTDSTNLSAEALASGREYIQANYGSKYLPEKPNVYTSKGGAQEAHEAIRPSDVSILATDISSVDRDAQRLYELIWRQFLACQMTPAKYENTTLTISAADYELKLKGRSVLFDGWTRVMKAIAKSAEEVILPAVKEGESFKLQELQPTQHFTKPPPRFSEASLVRELEKRGIGRPSTYASIISTIQDRGYVTTQNKRFYAEKIGAIVTERLCESFHELMTYSFTSDMEEKLDKIATGDKYWKDILDAFYQEFKAQLEKADSEDKEGMRANNPTPTDIPCPECGRHMMIRTGSTGVFLGCSGYSLPPKERCKGTLNLISGDEAVDAEQDEEGEARALIERKRCPKCATSMDSYLIDEQRKLHICGDNPDCDGFIVEQGQYRIKGYDGPIIECDKCGSDMQLKSGRFGKYFGCTNADCKNTRKLLRNGEAAPPKADPVHMPELPCEKSDGYFVLRDGAAGLFMASSAFPRSRETRAPLIRELLAHKAELDPKFLYLCDASVEDNKGNPVMIRFSRKNKAQYIMSEDKDGKATGWIGHYHAGQWDIELPKAKKKAAKKKTVKKKAVSKKKASSAKEKAAS